MTKIDERLKETIGELKPKKVYEVRLDDIKFKSISPEIKDKIKIFTKT